MRQQFTPLLDMTPEGGFRTAPVRATWPIRLGIGATLVAIAAAGLAIAAVLLWLASVLLPVALIAGAVAYTAFRVQAWRARR